MLQGFNLRSAILRAACLAAVTCVINLPAEAPLIPVSVCEVVRDMVTYEGKNIAVLGRYSFRSNGRWVGEQACVPATDSAPMFHLVESSSDAPRPPDNFDLDGVVLQRKWSEMQRHTSLGKFRFGNPDYDRWAVVYGRVMKRNGEDAKKIPADLLFRGSGVVMFLNSDQ